MTGICCRFSSQRLSMPPQNRSEVPIGYYASKNVVFDWWSLLIAHECHFSFTNGAFWRPCIRVRSKVLECCLPYTSLRIVRICSFGSTAVRTVVPYHFELSVTSIWMVIVIDAERTCGYTLSILPMFFTC